MNFKELMDEVVNLADYQQQVVSKVKSYCQDKSNPLELRWELFSSSGFGENEPYIWRPECLGRDHWRKLDYNRYEKVDLVSYVLDNEDDDTYSKELLDSLKEAIMQDFVKSFIVDW